MSYAIGVARLVQLCVRRLPSCVVDDVVILDDDNDDDADKPTAGSGDSSNGNSSISSIVSTCLLTSLRLLLNITHDNRQYHVRLL